MKYLGGIEELRLQAKIEGENVTASDTDEYSNFTGKTAHSG